MDRRWAMGLAAAALGPASLALAAAPQPAPPKEIAAQVALPTVAAPKQRDGHADFQGAWNRYPDLLMSPFLPNQPKAGDPLATPRQQPPPPLKPKYRTILEQRWKAIAAAAASGRPLAERSVACIPDGMPNVMRGAWIMEILQTPQQINISQELYNQTRRVYMNETLPAADQLDTPGFFGRSVGHFEGQVLVIETVGVREDVMPSSGAPGSAGGGDVPHSLQLKFVERLRYVAPDILQDQITMTDPEVFEGPWTWIVHYRRMPAGYKWQEYVCEANRETADPNGVQRRTDAEPAPAAAK